MRNSIVTRNSIMSIAVVLACGACTHYQVKRADGTELTITSTREFPNGINIEYESKEGAKLKIDAGKVTNQSSVLDEIVTKAVINMLNPPKEEKKAD